MLQPTSVVPKEYGGFLVHCTQLLVAEIRNTSIYGKDTQMHVDGDLRAADKVADVVDALGTHSLHSAQSCAIGLLVEPRAEIVAGIDPVGSQEVGDGVSRRYLLDVAELHGDGKSFCGEPPLKPTDCSRVRPVRLQPEKPRPEGRLIVAPGLEADVADDSTHVGPSAGLEKRTATQLMLKVLGEPLGRAGFGHRPMMGLWPDDPSGKRETFEPQTGKVTLADG
jgi:hypothetical protein